MEFEGVFYERKDWMKLASAIKKQGVDWEAAKEMAKQYLGCGEYGEGYCPGVPRTKSACAGLPEADCRAMEGCTWTKKTAKRAAHCRKTPDIAKARAALQAQRQTPQFKQLRKELIGKRTKRPATKKQPNLFSKVLQGVEEATGFDVAPPFKKVPQTKRGPTTRKAPAPLLALPEEPEEEPIVTLEDIMMAELGEEQF